MKYTIEELFEAFQNIDALKEEIRSLKHENDCISKENTRLLNIVEELQENLDRQNNTFRKYRRDPKSLLELPFSELMEDKAFARNEMRQAGYFNKIKNGGGEINTLNDLFQMSDVDILSYHGMGELSLRHIRSLQKAINEHEPGRIFHHWPDVIE